LFKLLYKNNFKYHLKPLIHCFGLLAQPGRAGWQQLVTLRLTRKTQSHLAMLNGTLKYFKNIKIFSFGLLAQPGRASGWQQLVTLRLTRKTQSHLAMLNGTLKYFKNIKIFSFGLLAQPGRASGWQSGGRGFEPRRVHMKPSTIALCILFLIALGLFLFSMYGCDYEPQKYMVSEEQQEKEEIKESTQLANPATLHCINTTGASWSAREGENGEYGICTFSDSSWCEEWAYFRGECNPGMNMTSCEGQYWGKSVCPADYNPVCGTMAEVDVETGEIMRTEKKTFNNACYACTYSKESMKVLGYVLGKC
jgi:putative hemolysin